MVRAPHQVRWWLVALLVLSISGFAMSVRPVAAQEVGEVFKDCDICPEMVVVPPGTFLMGSPDSEERRWTTEGPQHEVNIEYSFARRGL